MKKRKTVSIQFCLYQTQTFNIPKEGKWRKFFDTRIREGKNFRVLGEDNDHLIEFVEDQLNIIRNLGFYEDILSVINIVEKTKDTITIYSSRWKVEAFNIPRRGKWKTSFNAALKEGDEDYTRKELIVMRENTLEDFVRERLNIGEEETDPENNFLDFVSIVG